MVFPSFWRVSFVAYWLLLSWQLLTPATIVNAGSWDKLIHFSGFFVLAGLAMLARWKSSARTHALVLASYAALTEILQHFIPGRSFSVLDWVADSLGVVLAITLSVYFQERVALLSSRSH